MSRRNCKKNERTMYYALYSNKVPVLDENGNDTFETTIGYLSPVQFKASISTGKSDSVDSPFGSNVSYDRVIITTNKALPIDENSIIWKDKTPVINNGVVDRLSADYRVSAKPLDGLDSLKIAVKYNDMQNSTTNDETSEIEPVNDESDGF